MTDIHTLAEKYLRDVERGHAHFYAPPSNTEILTLADKFSSHVIVMRESAPQYLAGVTPTGRPVFTHDVKFASSYDSSSLKLIGVLRRLAHYEIEVETMPTCWFSNHQHE
jgi:hypothetical protein